MDGKPEVIRGEGGLCRDSPDALPRAIANPIVQDRGLYAGDPAQRDPELHPASIDVLGIAKVGVTDNRPGGIGGIHFQAIVFGPQD